ncbi:MAG: TIGR03013 family PEP-CTERM/XrtA system glycosyltransferase [Methylovulum sp.]|nr:TIGR03013 family PEP-CTERM/XrtA system glycosyltransferase [Methylovulum sp.]
MIRIFRHYISRAYLWLLVIEFYVFFNAMYLGNALRFLSVTSWYTEQSITASSFVFSGVMTLSCAGMGLYRRSLSLQDYNLLARTCASFSIAGMAIAFFYYFYPVWRVGPGVLAYSIVLAFLGIMLTRYLFYKFANMDHFKTRVLVVGSGQQAEKIAAINDLFIHRGFNVVGFVALSGEDSVVDKDKLICLSKGLSNISQEYNIDEIVVAPDDDLKEIPLDDLLDCKMSGVRVMNLIGFYEREQGLLSLDNMKPQWLIYCGGFAQGGLRSWEKRSFDLLASLMLFAVAWPFMLITALAIFLESGLKGPILYRQVRVGENNKNFEVLKFRSMTTDAEKNGAQWAQPGDSRITRVGRIIRKTRIDELPQLFNVLKGEMSFVGPRPERPEFVKGFNERIPFYRERHRVKPGITGWAQLCYPYGANEYDTIQKLQYDLYYVKNYSLFLDMSIMLNTVEVVLWGRGAR